MTASGIHFYASDTDYVLREVMCQDIQAEMARRQKGIESHPTEADFARLMEPISIVVPNEGMKEELMKYFAKHEAFKTTSLFEFLPINKWIESWLTPKSRGYSWEEVTTWALWKLFSEEPSLLENMPELCVSERDDIKTQSRKAVERFELASTLSDLFLRYVSYRLDWVLAWIVSHEKAYEQLKGDCKEVEDAHLFKEKFKADALIPLAVQKHPYYEWQRDLFLRLACGDDVEYEDDLPFSAPAKKEWPVLSMLRVLLERLGLFQSHDHKPMGNIYFFMPTTFPATILPYVKSGLQGSHGAQVHTYLRTYCLDETWIYDTVYQVKEDTTRVIDVTPERTRDMPDTVEEPMNLAVEGKNPKPAVKEHHLPQATEARNPMLEKNARSQASILYRWYCFMNPSKDKDHFDKPDTSLTRSVKQALEDLDRDASIREPWDEKAWGYCAKIAPEGSLLKAIKAALSAKTDKIDYLYDATDDSFLVVDAPTVAREVETVMDIILSHLNDQTNPCKPEDILVVMPDPASRRPSIERFLEQAKGTPSFFPYRFKGEAEEEVDKVYEAMMPVLKWRYDRLDRTDFIEWLNLPLVMQRHGLDLESVNLIVEWLDGAGFRYGLDPQSVQMLEGHAYSDDADMTLTRAVDRLLYARVMGAGAGPSVAYSLLPVEAGNGFTTVFDRPDVLDKLLAVVYDLISMQELLPSESCFVDQWQDALTKVLNRLTSHDKASACDMRQRISRFIRGAQDVLGKTGKMDGMLVVKSLIYPVLKKHIARGMADAVTFTDMRSYQGVTKKVVIIMGLDQNARFPGQSNVVPYDLMPSKWRVGDRDSRVDERNQFLDAMMSAATNLVLTYVSGTNLSPMPPSIVLDEVKSWLHEQLGEATLSRFMYKAPLSSWSVHRFSPKAGRMQAHSKGDLAIVETLEARRKTQEPPQPHVFLNAGWPQEPADKNVTIHGCPYSVVFIEEMARWINSTMKVSFKKWQMTTPEEMGSQTVQSVLHPQIDKGLTKYTLLEASIAGAIAGLDTASLQARIELDPSLGVKAWRSRYMNLVNVGHAMGTLWLQYAQHPEVTLDLEYLHNGFALRGKTTIYERDGERYFLYMVHTGIQEWSKKNHQLFLEAALGYWMLQTQSQALNIKPVTKVLVITPDELNAQVNTLDLAGVPLSQIEGYLNLCLMTWANQYLDLSSYCLIKEPDSHQTYNQPAYEWLTQGLDSEAQSEASNRLGNFEKSLKEDYLNEIYGLNFKG